MTDSRAPVPHRLRPARLEPRQDVIDILEEALRRARAGEMRGVVLTSELTGNRINFVASFNDGIMLGGHLVAQMALVSNAMMHMSVAPAPEQPRGRDALLQDEPEGDRGTNDLPGSLEMDGEREPE